MFRIHLFRDLPNGAPFLVYGAVDGQPALVREPVVAINPNIGGNLAYDVAFDPATGMVQCNKYGSDKALVRLNGGGHIVIFFPHNAPVLKLDGLYDAQAVSKIAHELSPIRMSNNVEALPRMSIPYDGAAATLAVPSRLKPGSSFWAESLPLKIGDVLSDQYGNTIIVSASSEKESVAEAYIKVQAEGREASKNLAAAIDASESSKGHEVVRASDSEDDLNAAAASPRMLSVKPLFGLYFDSLLAQLRRGRRVRNAAWPDNAFVELAEGDEKSFVFVIQSEETGKAMVRVNGWTPTNADLWGTWVPFPQKEGA